MAANAVLDLMHKNDLEPGQIGRIYLGTESALGRCQTHGHLRARHAQGSFR
jgi:3-hydroxy-3-methylglutaryl CoA synthase